MWGDDLEKTKLYRKRFIPNETVLLDKDEILFIDENVIVTKWITIRKREDFSHGFSCYFLKRGFKISKFFNSKNEFLYYYCDIIDTNFIAEERSFIVTDLLADVVVYKDGFVKVLDLEEIADALDLGIISVDLAKKALRTLNELLQIIYSDNLKNLTEDYFGYA